MARSDLDNLSMAYPDMPNLFPGVSQAVQNILHPASKTPAATTAPSIYNPTAVTGQGAYGLVPGQINVPEPLQQGIQNDLRGLVSPEIAAKLQNEAARFGVSSGMPGSGLQANRYLHDYLGASDVARERGYRQFTGLLPLAERNAELAAAPDPTQRAQTEQSFAMQMFNQYLAALRNPGGGGGGGYRAPNPAAGTGAYSSQAQPQAPLAEPGSPYPSPSPNSQDIVGDYINSYMDNPDSWMWPMPGAAPAEAAPTGVDALISDYLGDPNSWQWPIDQPYQ